MPPVRRHRIGEQMPAVVHPDPDPAAIDLCRELATETDAQAVVLFGSRAAGGWDEQSDLDMIIVRPAADSEDGREAIRQALAELRERYYPGCDDYHSPHHGVVEGLMVETLAALPRLPPHAEPRHRPGRPGGPHLHQGSPGRSRFPPRRRRLQRVGAGFPGKAAKGVRGRPGFGPSARGTGWTGRVAAQP